MHIISPSPLLDDFATERATERRRVRRASRPRNPVRRKVAKERE